MVVLTEIIPKFCLLVPIFRVIGSAENLAKQVIEQEYSIFTQRLGGGMS